jgi:Uma2 family endonuclease
MVEPSIRQMTLEEFLRWDDGTDRRCELIDGFPILIVEILSPSTERTNRRLKLPAYQTIESVREIMLIDADWPSCRALQTGKR